MNFLSTCHEFFVNFILFLSKENEISPIPANHISDMPSASSYYDDFGGDVSGKIEVAAIRGEKIPTGWAVNGEGRNTNDPK